MQQLANATSEAAARIAPHIRRTPAHYALSISNEIGADVWCKLENVQVTGSFKVRGAMNKLLCLDDGDSTSVVAASTGNHGAAVAYGCQRLDLPCTVYVPEEASRAKVEAIERRGATVRKVAGDPLQAERAARRDADRQGLVYISPYNDATVVAGQGTVGVELADQLDHCDVLVVAVGGGGLIAGTAAAVKARWPDLRVIGVSPQNSAVMARSVAAGRILQLDTERTLSDGNAGGVEEGAITFELCRELVDDWIEVTEDQIASELRRFIDTEHMLIEGSAAAALAGCRIAAQRRQDATMAVVLCGGNIGVDTLTQVLAT